jgi:hypothetical protein
MYAMTAKPSWWQILSSLSHPETVVFLVPITALVVFGMVAILKTLIRHRERMAMIERGMNPDFPAAQEEPQEKM